MTKLLILLAAGALGFSASAAQAGAYSDVLGKCLVRSSNTQDREVLVRYVFAALAAHPAVKPVLTVTAAQGEISDRAMAALVERLVLVDCRKEAVDVFKNEGVQSFGDSFKVLGEVAAQGMFQDPSVTPHLTSYLKYIDPTKFAGLASEIQTTPAK